MGWHLAVNITYSLIILPLLISLRQDICYQEAGKLTMCPSCDEFCNFWPLKDSCILSKVGLAVLTQSVDLSPIDSPVESSNLGKACNG